MFVLRGTLWAAFIYGLSAVTLQFLSSPASIYLPEKADVAVSDASAITNQLLGLTAYAPDGWSGKGDLLNRPEAAVVFLLNTADSAKPQFKTQIDSSKAANIYELNVISSLDALNYHSIVTDIESHFPSATIVRTNKDVITAFGAEGIEDTPLLTVEDQGVTDGPLKLELATIRRVQNWLENHPQVRNGAPDLYLFQIDSLRTVNDDNAVAAVKKLIQEFSRTIKQIYGDSCLIQMITADASFLEIKNRPKRQMQVDEPQSKNFTSYEFVNEDFPAMFAIILFTSIAIALIIFFVAVGLWFMEPGKDTIIYRMTSRAKKD